MGRRLSKDSQHHGLASNNVSFVLAGTGIPEYSGDSGVIRDSGDQPKGGSCKKVPPEKTRILKNPEESWQERKSPR
jgi:hypothetical protein